MYGWRFAWSAWQQCLEALAHDCSVAMHCSGGDWQIRSSFGSGSRFSSGFSFSSGFTFSSGCSTSASLSDPSFSSFDKLDLTLLQLLKCQCQQWCPKVLDRASVDKVRGGSRPDLGVSGWVSGLLSCHQVVACAPMRRLTSSVQPGSRAATSL